MSLIKNGSLYIIDVWKFPLIDAHPDYNRDYEFGELNVDKTKIVTESSVSYRDTLLCLEEAGKTYPIDIRKDEVTIIGEMFSGHAGIWGAVFLHHKASMQEFRTVVIDPHMYSYLICIS